MQLNDLRSAPGARRESCVRVVVSAAVWARPVAVATKVRTSRSGGKIAPGFEGGQQPLRRVCRSSASFR